ncbi:unnamed protein product [Mytilus coruscus]|uniref:Methyltransferase FkbM domain-containing protein n=1 Tax=Mytilus coruscus TaxID=42192 RepID=A0A6J8DB68_MYTCO|nr:unnamed protein product [Mytilus coruscus]
MHKDSPGLRRSDIYINNPKEDIVSRDIFDKNVWEPWGFNTVYKYIRHDPSIGVIDIGANIGVIALQLANVGRKVIAIEPTPQNTQHLCASIIENGYFDQITVVHNALSNDHQDVPFAFPSKGEYTLGFVDQGKDNVVKEISKVGFVLLTLFLISWFMYKVSPGLRRSGKSFDDPAIYTFSDVAWNRNVTVCKREQLQLLKSKHYFQKGVIKSDYGKIDIHINDPKEDIVSRDIYDKNVWEPWGINTIYKYIRHDPSIAVIDMGANIGVIALQLANMGRKVIAIEPTPQNTQHLCASIIENGFSDQITVVHNALSNDHKDVPFAFPKKGEFALGFVEQGKQEKDDVVQEMSKLWGNFYNKNTVLLKAAKLDDIITLPEFKAISKVFLKIDVQGFEHKVFEGAEKLFQSGKVKGIYIEWYYHRDTTSGKYLLQKFKEWDFEPFYCNDVLKDVSSNLDTPCENLDVKKSGSWGADVVFLPRRK